MNEVKFKANINDLKAVQAKVEAIPAIPEPTVANEGKVVTVIVDSSGETPVAEYGLATPSGGGGSFLIIDSDDNDNSLTQTAAAIISALESGQLGLCRGSHDTGSSWSYYGLLTAYTYDDRGGSYIFSVYPFGGTEAWEYTASTLNDYPVPV